MTDSTERFITLGFTEPFITLGIVVGDDTELTPSAQRSGDGAIAAVRIGTTGGVGIQSSSPAALRRLAAVLNDAADKAEAITEAGE